MSLEKHKQLRERTKSCALRIIRMSNAMPNTRAANVISSQILRSATGMAANYRAVGRARSKAEFIAKIGVVLEEADETVFWLEMLSDAGILKPAKLRDLLGERMSLLQFFLLPDVPQEMTDTSVFAPTPITAVTRSRAITGFLG